MVSWGEIFYHLTAFAIFVLIATKILAAGGVDIIIFSSITFVLLFLLFS